MSAEERGCSASNVSRKDLSSGFCHEADNVAKMREMDGRRRRDSGATRDAQINFKVSRSTKAEIVAAARRLNRPMEWVLEHGFELLLEEEAAGKGN